MHQDQKWEALNSGRKCVIGLLLLAACLPAWSIEKFADYDYQDKINSNKTLIVFFAGLHGAESWGKLTKLIDDTQEFNDIDYLAYHSPPALNIEENVQRAQAIFSTYRDQYTQTIFVGHSIGGIMIKRLLMLEADKGMLLPEMVITLGTPFDTDKFTISLFKRLSARIFWFGVPPLKRESFNLDRLKQINSSWRTAVTTNPIKQITMINVFGVEDEIAEAHYEGNSKNTIFITGDHLGIITPESKLACSWKVFRAVVLDPSTDLQEIDCVLPKPTPN